jgi:hypothetical protein
MNTPFSGIRIGLPEESGTLLSASPTPQMNTMSSLIPPASFSDTSSETLGATSHYSLTPNEYSRDSVSDLRTSTIANQNKRKGRKGHTKSRKGCYNCKRARIKVRLLQPQSRNLSLINTLQCKENRPSCDYCAHRGLTCEWPDMQVNQLGTLIRNTVSPVSTSASSIPISLQSNVPVFSPQDFRLFQHFIETAYPHHPIGNDSIWQHEIPSIASDVGTSLPSSP